MKNPLNNSGLPYSRQIAIVILRILIGWHFLYEGLIKLMNPGWTSENYLMNTRGLLSGIFHAIAGDPELLLAVNFINEWGLVLIGAGLFFGILARAAAYSGILILLLYYVAYPPFAGLNFGAQTEGNYLLIDKNFIELASLVLLSLFPETLDTGLFKLFRSPILLKRKSSVAASSKTVSAHPENGFIKSRRELIKQLVFVPFLGLFAWAFSRNKSYSESVDASSGSTVVLKSGSVNEIEGKMPVGMLGEKMVSRLILGGNLIASNSHSRDLLYVDTLFKAYNTEKKVFETLMLAEQAGINTINVGTRICPLINRYRKLFGSKLQMLVTLAPEEKDIYGQVDYAAGQGADFMVIQGATCDRRVFEGRIDIVGKCIDYIRQLHYPAGLGAHSIEAMTACLDAGIECDFYYKTMHHDRYWSAHPRENRRPYIWSSNISENHDEFHDNMWCMFPEKTVDFVQQAKKPVIAFKVLAGGAIHPEDGFQYAFDNGADFLSVGMFDFQIVGDTNILIRSYEKAINRKRAWLG